VTPTAPTMEHPCPIRRRVRRSAKKSFHVSCGCEIGGPPAAGCEDADDAFRIAILLAKPCRAAAGELCDCEALLGRVHVEKEAVAVEMGAMMAGGKRFANVLAGHKALRASIVALVSMCNGEVAGRRAHCGLLSRYVSLAGGSSVLAVCFSAQRT
jgi:hypothetical protein